MALKSKPEIVLSKTYRKVIADKPRQIAFEVFTEVMRNGAYSNLLLPKRLVKSDLERRDRAFITELVYGSIRQIGRNDFIASKFSNKPWSEVDAGIVDVIRMGAYQLFDMRIPTHAAVDATTNIARAVLGESKATFVNAVMRKMSAASLDQHLIDVQGDDVSSLSIRYSHPEWIINSYRDFISDLNELKELLNSNNTPAKPTLVSWPSKSTQEELISEGAVATKFSKFGASYDGNPLDIKAVAEKRAGVQDEGSQILAQIFAQAAKAKEPWLDLCAGPGGKAALLSYLAAGDFYANEINASRAKLVSDVVAAKTKINVGDGREIDLEVNAILADVPCTGLGALRRRPEVRWRRTPADLPALSKLQFELAAHAIEILPSGGIFGYATCSPHVAETSAQCATFEKKFEIDKIDVTPFMPEGLNGGVRNGYMQLWPHRHETDAMFLALYRKR